VVDVVVIEPGGIKVEWEMLRSGSSRTARSTTRLTLRVSDGGAERVNELASTLEHVLRTFGARSAPSGRRSPP
jgi:hypothetical protein